MENSNVILISTNGKFYSSILYEVMFTFEKTKKIILKLFTF